MRTWRMFRWPTILLLTTLLVVSLGYSDCHLRRNEHNQLPVGNLMRVDSTHYVDEVGRNWELLPQNMNIFHQPDTLTVAPDRPYPNLDVPPAFESETPNLKLLSLADGCASHEAILQPDGTYLTTGSWQGTYNYCHPEGFWGSVGHFFADMLPGFVNSDYK